MPPRARAKPVAEPAGSPVSDSEPDLDMFDKSDLQAAMRTMSTNKKPRGRPPGSASKITKPAQRATRRTGTEKLPAVPEVVARSDTAVKANGNGTNATRKAQQMAPDETVTFEDIEGSSGVPATGVKKGTRGRPKKSNGDTSILVPESTVKRRGRPPRQPGTPIAEVLETQQEDPMELDPVLEQSETDNPGAVPEVETIVPWSSYDTSDDSTRWRLEDLTKKYTALEASHRNLREVGVREAERNFERLKQQAEERTAAELKAELAAQTALANESEELRKQLEANETETEMLEETVKTLNSSLTEAKSEIKSLSTKLAAARSSDTNPRVPGSAIKTGGLMNRNAQAGAAHAAQVTAQAKERLYADLTDLILRGVKQDEVEDTFDCIQTGRNGTLHFKLAVENDASGNYEDVSFTYQPQLDAGRDQDLIDVLPGYLTEEITFPRSQAPKFYARVNKSLTEDLTRQ
ncbi:hypothetical protein FPOAC1_002047 [Fusarium poae]|uniref:hypothetical protein n=1 Tax=Fusarium poae TaxID=36050 RepID=UPI001CE8AEFC|nr:hypothetical protein FPOAC1_002047 [Fusarium poae]KAG8676051.1 hypothetical protein FPOAC1_002047 [Fusarium poae]